MAHEVKEAVDRLEGLITRLESMVQHEDHCREKRYRQALLGAVSVLITTKNSFHSRQLKQLRENLEAALK